MSVNIASRLLPLPQIHPSLPTLLPPLPPYYPGELLHILQYLIQYHPPSRPLQVELISLSLVPLATILHITWLWLDTVISLTHSQGRNLILGPL